MKFFEKVKQFFKEVQIEMKRINWLSRKDVVRYTLMVIIFAVVVAVYLGGIDFVVQWIIGKYILKAS